MKEVIKIIQGLNKEAQKKVALLFIKELSASIQNCNSIGLQWGAEGQEIGANKQAIQYLKDIKRLEQFIL